MKASKSHNKIQSSLRSGMTSISLFLRGKTSENNTKPCSRAESKQEITQAQTENLDLANYPINSQRNKNAGNDPVQILNQAPDKTKLTQTTIQNINDFKSLESTDRGLPSNRDIFGYFDNKSIPNMH